MVSRLTFAELFILSCCIHATVALQPILSGAFNRALHPIVYVPGFGDNQLQAKLSRSTVLNPSCQKKSDYFMVWLNLSMFFPRSVRCLTEDLRLVYRKSTRRTYDVTGVDVNVPGFGDTKTIKAPSNNANFNSGIQSFKLIPSPCL
ncbi:PLA2G15 (predicted) [Pycnogonum litorale]